MSDLVPENQIERIVGAQRHPLRHLARADSKSNTVYVLHSMKCKASGIDLRQCSYSRWLDRGIDLVDWYDWEDRPVVLGVNREGRLVPLRSAQ